MFPNCAIVLFLILTQFASRRIDRIAMPVAAGSLTLFGVSANVLRGHLDRSIPGVEGHRRAKRSMTQLAIMIRILTQKSPFLFNDYGNYCGWGEGQGPIRDEIDGCCYEHDECYRKAKYTCLPNTEFPSLIPYGFAVTDTEPQKIICTNSVECERFICECDFEAASCFATHPYKPHLKRQSILDVFIRPVEPHPEWISYLSPSVQNSTS